MSLAEEDHEGNVLRALRTTEWKLIDANPGNPRGLPPEELFHVSADPGETQQPDRASARSWPARCARRPRRSSSSRAARRRRGGEAAKLSDAQQEALKALGYAE